MLDAKVLATVRAAAEKKPAIVHWVKRLPESSVTLGPVGRRLKHWSNHRLSQGLTENQRLSHSFPQGLNKSIAGGHND